ncbi:MAG TPA: ASKHA domain-containing protein [Anaerolineae bacterium]|nr:ASKHA domain-containing protein [Anaerolineae bacterium]
MTNDAVYVEFEPVGRRGPCPAAETLLEAAHALGVDLTALCGGKGTCGRCLVQVIAGPVSPPTATETRLLTPAQLQAGYRLACQTQPEGAVRVRIPAESLTTPQRTLVEGLEVPVEVRPAVTRHELVLTAPTLEDPTADDVRVKAALARAGAACHTADTALLRTISPLLREWDWRASAVVRGGEWVALLQPGQAMLGLAVDVGTTKVAAYLVDLQSGRTLASRGVMNPQIAYGEDVITRVGRTMEQPAEARRLQSLVSEALNQMVADMTAETGTVPEQVVEAVLVGNTAMHHLLAGLPASQVALSPYVAAVGEAMDVKARELGLVLAPGAYAHLLPNLAGFVGADHLAMILATGLADQPGLVLALDIGTNTEVSLSDRGQIASVSCASGPAFEGAHIKHGMRAAAGAIERIKLENGQVTYQTIGGGPAVGLCGSGILDGLAQLYLAGAVDRGGRMQDAPGVRGTGTEREFVLVSEEERRGAPALTITQRDVRELQLAKGAIRTGIEALLHNAGRRAEELQQVIVAGAFGSYIDVSSAITVGLLPRLPLERYVQVGNAAGTGARLCLLSAAKRAEVQAIARRVHYLELARVPGFERLFASSMYLGE